MTSLSFLSIRISISPKIILCIKVKDEYFHADGKIDKLADYMADLERELSDKQASAQLLEREVTDGRRRCIELEEEIDQVNKEIGEACSDRNETSRAQRRAEPIENLKQFPGV
ncbi:unnamed protein product, partial [Rotaria magnacalcarata]